PPGKPNFKISLQWVVAVVGAVAEEVNSLRPSEPPEEGLAFVRIRLTEIADRLVYVKCRSVSCKYVSALVADVGNLNRRVAFELMLNRYVPRINCRQCLSERTCPSKDAVGEGQLAIRRHSREKRSGR